MNTTPLVKTDPWSAMLGMAIAGASAFAIAQPSNGPVGQNRQPSGPPPEAVAACVGKLAGASASFTMRDGHTVTGVCSLSGNVMAVRPDQSARPPMTGASAP